MKVLFTDLDGTLLNKKSSVTEYTRNILKEFTDQGNMVVPCSGRPLLSMQKLLESEGLSDIAGYIIAYNGALVWDCAADKPVWESGISIDTAYTIQNECITRGIHIQTYADEHIVTLTGDTEIDYYKKKIFLPVIFTDDPVSVCKRPPYKLLAIDLKDHDKLCKLKDDLAGKIGDEVNAVFSNPYYLEFFNMKAGKSNGMHELCRHLDIDIADTIAAGDEENDISMIEAAGTGIAVANATDRVKASADVVTEADNDNDALACWLAERFTLAD